MEDFRKIILLMTIFSFMSVGWGCIGDINHDNEVNVFDILIVVDNIVNDVEIPYDIFQIGDLNIDEELNIFDILLLVQIILSDNICNDTFFRTFGEPDGNDVIYSGIQTYDKHYISIGQKNNDYQYDSIYTTDMWIIKFDSLGILNWEYIIENSSVDSVSIGKDVVETIDSNYVFLYYKPFQSFNRLKLLKTNRLGELIWEREYGGDSLNISYRLVYTNDGGFIFNSYYQPNPDPYFNYNVLIKTDELGEILWTKIYYDSSLNIYGSRCWDIIQTSDNGYGYVGQDNEGKIFIMKVDSLGNEEWSTNYGDDYGQGVKIVEDNNQNYYVSGLTEDSDGKPTIIKIDYQGNILWSYIVEPLNSIFGYGYVNIINNNIILSGFITGSNYSDLFIYHFDGEGNPLWNNFVTINDNFFGFGFNNIKSTHDNHLLMNGYISIPPNNPKRDYFILKTDMWGNFLTED